MIHRVVLFCVFQLNHMECAPSVCVLLMPAIFQQNSGLQLALQSTMDQFATRPVITPSSFLQTFSNATVKP